jgi:hypothetical protein
VNKSWRDVQKKPRTRSRDKEIEREFPVASQSRGPKNDGLKDVLLHPDSWISIRFRLRKANESSGYLNGRNQRNCGVSMIQCLCRRMIFSLTLSIQFTSSSIAWSLIGLPSLAL